MADRPLVLVPHKQTHGPRSILEKAGKLGSDVTEMGAIKHTMELIAIACVPQTVVGHYRLLFYRALPDL